MAHVTLGLTVERGGKLPRASRSAPDPLLAFTLGDGALELEIQGASRARLDRASWALVPARTPHRFVADHPLVEIACVSLVSGAVANVVAEYRGDVDAARFERILRGVHVLPRTRWVDELVHRYVFEHEVCGKKKSLAARFLETELAKELYFACLEREEKKTRASVVAGESDVVATARAFIDERIAAPLKVEELARACHVSVSSLLRIFQRELGTTPAAFARKRKLDAAHLLLESKSLTVGEVAARVGYGNLAAFTTAFGKQFGEPPTAVSRADRGLERLPPHGKPPKPRRAPRRK